MTLLLERGSFAHRFGWAPESIAGVALEVLGSAVLAARRSGKDLGYRIDGVRAVPWRLPFALGRIRPDVVVVCNATQMLFALSVRWLLGFKLALIVEDTRHATRNLSRLAKWLRGWTYRRADHYFPFSDDAVAYLRSIDIRNGMSRSSWSLSDEWFANTPRGWDISVSPDLGVQRVVLFAGRLVEGKGVSLLVQAWAGVPARLRSGSVLVIAGDGPLRATLENQCFSAGLTNIRFLGNVDYREMQRLFRGADLFVLPTLQDLYSLTVLEAMATGCPVVTTPFNGARELIEEGTTGWVVDPTLPGALSAVLERALDPATDLAVMGEAAQVRVAGMDNRAVMDRFANELKAIAGACVAS